MSPRGPFLDQLCILQLFPKIWWKEPSCYFCPCFAFLYCLVLHLQHSSARMKHHPRNKYSLHCHILLSPNLRLNLLVTIWATVYLLGFIYTKVANKLCDLLLENRSDVRLEMWRALVCDIYCYSWLNKVRVRKWCTVQMYHEVPEQQFVFWNELFKWHILAKIYQNWNELYCTEDWKKRLWKILIANGQVAEKQCF